MSAVLLGYNNSLHNAFKCTVQPDTALHDGVLYSSQYLRSRHFIGLCKSVHPWARVSKIQSIKEALPGCKRCHRPGSFYLSTEQKASLWVMELLQLLLFGIYSCVFMARHSVVASSMVNC